MDDTEARTRLLDAAERLFYARGIQAVGMDEIRATSGVPLKRLYRLFPAKTDLVAAYLTRRDTRWLHALREALHAAAPADRLDALFTWLADWFTTPDFRGCAFVNAYGEFGDHSPEIAGIARAHKTELRALLATITADDPERADARTDERTDELALLVEGAIAVAALNPSPAPARTAHRLAAARPSR